MLLGPIRLGGDFRHDRVAQNVENAWQFSKVYPQHVDANGNPTQEWWEWSSKGMADTWAHRYPMGKGAIPLYSYWRGCKLDYVQARTSIYLATYIAAVRHYAMPQFTSIQRIHDQGLDVVIRDFDAYDHHALGYDWMDVLRDETRKMGHGFALGMMLDGLL